MPSPRWYDPSSTTTSMALCPAAASTSPSRGSSFADDLPVVVDRHQHDERHRRTSTVNTAGSGNQATPSCRAEISTR